MNWDDIVYLSLLGFSICFGYVFRSLGANKQNISTVLGLLITVLVSGYHAIHPIIGTLLTIIILKVVHKRSVHKVSLLCLFTYLLFFRLCHYVGLPMAPAHTNAIQMILILKLVGLCFEVHDTWRKREELKKGKSKDEEEVLKLELKYEEIDPLPIDVFHYAFCYIGVLTGPYYKYRVYNDMLLAKETMDGLDCVQAMWKRIKYVPFYAAMFLLSAYFFPLSFAESTEIFRDYSFLFRVCYMTPIFFNFRMRIYSGFVLAECACIMAGLGAYPSKAKNRPGKGPTNYDALEKCKGEQSYDFETIHNIDEYGSDFSPTVRSGMRCWNMTVQYWLASNIYKRMTLARPIKEAITMLVSAFWHGVYSGYYLSMLTVPFILAVEDFYDRILRRKLSDSGQRIYDWITWVMKMQLFAYMGMAFLLLRVDATVHYWRSIGFIYHGFIVVMHAIAQYVNLISGKVEKKLENSRQTSRIGDTKIRYMRTAVSEKNKEEEKKDK